MAWGWQCSNGPQGSVVQHPQSMKGTKASAKSISPLFYIILVEENILTKGGVFTKCGCGENSPHTSEEALGVSQLLLATPAGTGAGGDCPFFYLFHLLMDSNVSMCLLCCGAY